MNRIESKMIGKTIEFVGLNEDKTIILFKFKDGYSVRGETDADCCSTTWIEHLEMPDNLNGAVLISIDDSAPITQDHDAHDEENGGDCIEVYNTVFKTDRGDIVLEYRNSSNGYYGGSIKLYEINEYKCEECGEIKDRCPDCNEPSCYRCYSDTCPCCNRWRNIATKRFD